MGILGTMTVSFNANVTNFQSGIKNVTDSTSNFAKNTQKGAGVVIGAFALAGAAVVGFGALSVKSASDFQQSMLKVQAYAGLTKQQMDSMSSSILDMATKVGQSPKALADAIYPIISSGYGAADALNILKLSAETAAASGAKTSVVADALTTSLGAMHAPASQAGHYMDMFNKIVSLGKGEVPQYAAVIGKLSLAASGAGIDFGTMGAALADLTTHGFPSVAQASTALGSLFTQVGVKTDAMAQHAKAAGIAFDAHKFATLDLSGKLNYLQQVTGGNQGELLKLIGGSTLALKAFNALEGGSKDLASNLGAMKNSAGATDSAFRTASSGLNATMARAQASIETLQVKIGTALLPVITSLVDKVAPAVTSFLDWADKNHIVENAVNGVTTAINGIGAAMNFIIPVVSNVVHFFQQHHAAMAALQPVLVAVAGVLGGLLVAALTSVAIAAWAAVAPFVVFAGPFVLVGAIVALVIAGIVLAVQHWGDIVKWFQGVWSGFTDWLSGSLGGIKEKWNEAANSVVGNLEWLYGHNYYFKDLVDFIHNVTANISSYLGGVWKTISTDAVNAWGILVTEAKQLWNNISQPFIHAWDQYISPALNTLLDNIKGLWNGFVNNADNLGKNLMQSITGGIKKASGNVADLLGFHDAISTAQKSGGDLISVARNTGSNILSWAQGLAGSLAKSPLGSSIIKSLQDGLGQIIPQLAQVGTNLRTQLGGAISGILPAFSNLSASLKFVWDDFVQLGQLLSGSFISTWKLLQGTFSLIGQMLSGSFASTWKLLQITLTALWQMLAGSFISTWKILQGTFAALAPVFSQVGAILGGQFMNALKMVGIIIGGVVLIAISALLGMIVGFAQGLTTFIGGVTKIITGIVQVFSGVFQIIAGLDAFIIDLLTGHWNKLGADLKVITGGIVQVFTGMWNIISGLFQAVIGTVISYVTGFVTTVVGFFTNLYNSLVGHSIIPDLVNGIVGWFMQLPGRVMNFLQSLPGKIANLWSTIVTDATNAGTNIVKGIADGINNAIHFVTDAITNVTSWISAHLPHSPAKVGPLKDLALQGSMIVDQVSIGMLSNQSKLNSTIAQLAKPINANLKINSSSYPASASNNSSAILAAVASSASNNSKANQVIENHIYIDGKEVTSKLGPHIANAIRASGSVRSR